MTLERYLLLKWLVLSIFGGNIWTPLIVSILIKDFTHEYTCVRFWLPVLTLVYSLPQSFFEFYWFQWGCFTLWCFESEPHIERTEVSNCLVPLGILLCWLWVARDPLYDLIVSVYPKWCVTGSWVNCKLKAGSRCKSGYHFDDNDPQMMLEYCKMGGISSSTY